MKLAQQRAVLAVAVLVAGALMGCQGDRGRAGVQTLLLTTDLAAGEECSAGGVRVETGPDQNRNRTLDAEEVAATSIVCRPPSGLVNVTSLPSSEECPFGSTLITSGVDANGDGLLAEAELSTSELFCAPREDDFDGLVFLAPVYKESDKAPTFGLYRARADGSGFMPLAATRDAATGITSFALSPDKKRVAFLAQMDADSKAALFVVSLMDGEPAREISGKLFNAEAAVVDYAWSPDGARIAFTAKDESTGKALYVMRPDGTLRVRLDDPNPNTPNIDISFAWAPGGDVIAFWAKDPNAERHDLYTVPAAGGVAPTQISCGKDVYTTYAWSPDGAHLAFFENTSGSAYGLRLGTPGEACASPTPDPIATLRYYFLIPLSLAWQPVAADAILLFGGYDPVDVTTAKVYVYNPTSGGSPAQVGCDLEAAEKSRDAVWAPDGSMIAYRSNADQTVPGYRLYLASPSGDGSCTAVSAGPSTGFEVAGFMWSPTSELLLYNTAKIDGKSHRGELYVVPEGGGAASVLHGSVCVKATAVDAECGQTFAFAEDGRAAFIGQRNSGGLSLFVATPGAGAGTAVSGETITGLWNLAWAPDGGRIAFIGREGTDALAHLYTVTPEGEGLVQLSPDDMPASMQLPDYEAKYSW